MNVHHRANICFHGIGTPGRDLEPGEHQYWISTELFDEILDYVAANPRVSLSFDDGNASDAEIGLPALAARRLRAAFFPVAARIGQPGSIDRRGLRALVAHGMTIGSHGMHHRNWRGLKAADLDEELVQARKIIAAESGTPVTTAACPLGLYDRAVLRRLRALDYLRVFTSDRSIASAKAWLQPRYSVRGTDTIDDIHAIVEDARPLGRRVESAARIAVKRLR